MALIEVISHSEAEGELKEVYDSLVKTRGQLANVHTIQSLNPKSIINHMDLYMTLMYGKSPLKRVVREMMAVVVSKANNCEYCQTHHLHAVNHYWKNNDKLKKFGNSYDAVELKPVELKLCEFAKVLTQNPSADQTERIAELKQLGLSDKAILDATMIVGYFNFVNRIILALKVNIESDNGGGYNYE